MRPSIWKEIHVSNLGGDKRVHAHWINLDLIKSWQLFLADCFCLFVVVVVVGIGWGGRWEGERGGCVLVGDGVPPSFSVLTLICSCGVWNVFDYGSE